MIITHRITIIKIRKPRRPDINDSLNWLGTSLGLFNMRDKDKSCYRLFIELLKASKSNYPMTSDEMAISLDLTRGTVVHHLNRLMESGIVVHEGKYYLLRMDNLEHLMDELQKDLERTLLDLKDVARNIDAYMRF